MINPRVFHDQIIFPALRAIGEIRPKALKLITGTALVESNLEHVRQMGGGNALGYFQMETSTHEDIWTNFLTGNRLQKYIGGIREFTDRPANANELEVNPFYAAQMCRIHYLRIKEQLPNENDLGGMAVYWKKYYNTPLGKGIIDDFMDRAHSIISL